MHARSLSLALVIGFVPAAVAQKPTAADLTIRSHAILAKHCAECHGDKPVRTELNVLDHVQMVKHRPVSLVRSKDPTASQVLELIEEGSMPPGKNAKISAEEVAVLREWVASGAAAYPVRFDDTFAHEAILANIKEADPDDVPSFRYLTLHHLADGPTGDLTTARPKFLEALRSVLKPGAVGPRPIDPTATIFRIDLRDAGWDHKPFIKLSAKKEEDGQAKGNVFDVVLLEYPYATMPAGSAAFEELGQKFLRPADQVRPVVFVRGDWFVEAATTVPLANDLRVLVALGAQVPSGLATPKPAPSVVPTPVATPIPAVDSWYADDPVGESTVKGLKIETVDFSRNVVRNKFAPEERFRLRISADEPMFFQLVWLDSTGKVDTWTSVRAYTPGKPHNVPLPEEDGLDNVLGRERLMVFASPHEFAPNQTWRAKHPTKTIERFVHPFFELKGSGTGLAPNLRDAKVTRRTVTIEIVKPDKK